VVDTPDVVWHTTTGSSAVTVAPEPEPEPFVVEVEVEAEAEAAVVDVAGAGAGAGGLVVVGRFGWVDPVVEAGPDDPHAAKRSAPETTAPAQPTVR
jgi:hypothetical protein